MTESQQQVAVVPSSSLPVAPVLAPVLMMAFWMLLGGAAGVRLMEGIWRLFGLHVGEVSIVVPVGSGVGAVGGALLGLISNPRLLVLLMAVFAGAAAGAVAGKLPWGDIGEIGGQVAGGLVGGMAWAGWLFFGLSKKANLLSPAQADPERMARRMRAVAFDLDAASLIALRHACPEWSIDVVKGATAASLSRDWNPGTADLLVMNSRPDVAETLALCRFLAFCTSYSRDSRNDTSESALTRDGGQDQERRANAPLLVLAPGGQESLVRAVMDAGAHRCLMLPIDAKQVASMLLDARASNGMAGSRALPL
jgi:hypothetical protein